MSTVIISDNLVNDYCGIESRYTSKPVNIGKFSSNVLFGSDDQWGNGPLPAFLRNQSISKNKHLLFVRDAYTSEESSTNESIIKLGEHCIVGSPGHEFPNFLQEIVSSSTVIDCSDLALSIGSLRTFFMDQLGMDILASTTEEERSKTKVLITGFHTERRVFNTANILKNLFGFKVAVFSHFVASSNREVHFNVLRYQFSDSGVIVLNDKEELEEFLGEELPFLDDFNLSAVRIEPEEVRTQLNENQRKIVETICMHWSEAKLRPLGGGFSGSALFLANGMQGKSRTEPMVIKIDSHHPIQMEVRGYNMVKDFLGKHVPAFTFPVTDGPFMGIGMELAAMEGPPTTLQDHFERIEDDYSLDAFLSLLDRTLGMLLKRVYQNTYSKKPIAPFRHFMLHISQQGNWLKANLENMERHKTDKVLYSPEVVLNIFNLVRNNSDAIFSDVCIGHGDLNLANIIVDEHGNLWTIDWTHTGHHPLAIDFAKMENDVKFVISKEISNDDLPKLQILEEHLLSELIPPSISELPDHLQFIKWDLRFKKIYRTIRRIRTAFSSLMEDDNWLVYKIALLRYSLHTLSFDKTIDQGECSPAQLWYTVVSTESILFQLVADDYNLKIRSERPESYPERFRLQIDSASWQVECPEYDTPYYVAKEVLNAELSEIEQGKIDSEDNWEHEKFYNWGLDFLRDSENKPLNPKGRTGIAGRGSLWFWGPNPMVYFIPLRFDKQSQNVEILLNSETDRNPIVNVHMRRHEELENAISRIESKIPFGFKDWEKKEIHSGYLYDPRQTDNAWVEGKAFVTYYTDAADQVVNTSSEYHFVWKVLEPSYINDLYSTYAELVRQ